MKKEENMGMQENEAGRVDVLIRLRTETKVWLSEEMRCLPLPLRQFQLITSHFIIYLKKKNKKM